MRRGVLLARVSPRCSRAHAPRLMKSKQSWWPGARSTLPVKELVHESRGLVESKQSWSPAQDRCLSSPRCCGCGMKPKHKVGRPGPGSARVVAATVAASAAAVAARRGAEDAVSAACGRGFREGSRSGLGQPSATWEGREGGREREAVPPGSAPSLLLLLLLLLLPPPAPGRAVALRQPG